MKQIKEHFNNKNNFIVFLIIFIGIMCPLFSGKLEFNFWTNMNDVLTSPVAIICLFIASIINTYKYIRSYASKCLIKICNELIREKKVPCLFCDNEW